MFNHTKLAKNLTKQFSYLSITGLTVNQFDFLYNKEIKKNYKITEQKRLSKNREREIDAGHKFDLFIKDRILMFMMYYKTYPTYDVLGTI